ncbi:MAG: hypothetical protein HY329_17650, partial [Chloroflexi bacterium]|nr:hypothetical protein [Chloroflexota bacterium]
IWTKHFTQFTVRPGGTTTPPTAGGGGSSGGGGGGSSTPICEPSCGGGSATPLVSAPTGTATVSTQPVGTLPQGIPAATEATGGTLVQVSAAASGGYGQVTTQRGSATYVTALVPARNVPLYVRLQPLGASSLSVQPGAGTTVSRVFSLDVYGSNGALLGRHDAPVMIAIQVPTEALSAVNNDARRLAVVRYDAATGLWFRLPTSFNSTTRVAQAESVLTSTFALVVLPPELADVVVARALPLVPVNSLAATRANLPFLVRNVQGWNSGFQVQSLGGAANVTIAYFNAAGQPAGSQSATIAAGASQTFFNSSLQVPDGFVGSAVVTADQPIAVIVNELTAGPARSASYDGVAVPTSTQFLPLVMRNNAGWNTELFVQNAGTAPATVTLEYYQGSALITSQALPAIAPGASARVRQADQTSLGSSWVGSVKVVSDQPVATMVNEIHDQMLMSYSGFAGGVSRVSIPLVMTDNSGWSTGLQVQNVGSSAVPVTLKVNGAVVAEVMVGPGGSQTWFPVPGTQPGFVGAATVEGPAGSQLVAIVNQLHPATGQAMSYRGFGGGSAVVNAPLIMTDNQGWFTGLQVQNAGTEATTVRLLVNGAVVESISLAPGQSQTWYPVPGTTAGFVGSVTVQGDAGSQLVAIVNEIYRGADLVGEAALAYEATNQ